MVDKMNQNDMNNMNNGVQDNAGYNPNAVNNGAKGNMMYYPNNTGNGFY